MDYRLLLEQIDVSNQAGFVPVENQHSHTLIRRCQKIGVLLEASPSVQENIYWAQRNGEWCIVDTDANVVSNGIWTISIPR